MTRKTFQASHSAEFKPNIKIYIYICLRCLRRLGLHSEYRIITSKSGHSNLEMTRGGGGACLRYINNIRCCRFILPSYLAEKSISSMCNTTVFFFLHYGVKSSKIKRALLAQNEIANA